MFEKDFSQIRKTLASAKITPISQIPRKEKNLKKLEIHEFHFDEKSSEFLPAYAVDGSYCFLLSDIFTGAMYVSFRIAITHFLIEKSDDGLTYIKPYRYEPLDTIKLLSFNKKILKAQPKIYSQIARVAKRFGGRQPQVFATNLMLYLEDKVIKVLSKTHKNSLLLKDGPLTVSKAFNRGEVYDKIYHNCVVHNNMLVGISKSTSSHIFKDVLTDDYFLTNYYNDEVKKGYIHIPESKFKSRHAVDSWGNIYFAKLNEHATKWFRVDIINNIKQPGYVFANLGVYSKYQYIPGYPIPLAEAHKIAKSIRSLKEMYEDALINNLQQAGVQTERLLQSRVNADGRELSSFHSIIDL